MKFCMGGHLADVINRAKFYLNQIRGFDSVGGGSNFWLSHKKEKSPLTQGLNYRSACDRPTLVRFKQAEVTALAGLNLTTAANRKQSIVNVHL